MRDGNDGRGFLLLPLCLGGTLRYLWRKLEPMQLWQSVVFDNGLGGLYMFCNPFSFNKIQCGFVFNPIIFAR